MLDKTTVQFSHVKPGETQYRSEGLRDFFLYRDLGIAEATAASFTPRHSPPCCVFAGSA